MSGYVYQIYYNHNDVKYCYIGSSCYNPEYRFQQHKIGYRRYKKTNKQKLSIYEYFDKYNVENFNVITMKKIEKCDSHQLKAYEQLYINQMRYVSDTHLINQNCSFSLYVLFKKKYQKKYVLKNNVYTTCNICQKKLKTRSIPLHLKYKH